MNKKIKSIFDEKWRQERLAKLPPREREVVEKRIIRSEKLAAKWRREEEALMRLPKEDRLKKLYGKYLKMALEFGITIGHAKNRKEEMALKETFGKLFRPELTHALKKAEVLPL